jgi:hypothetical protein
MVTATPVPGGPAGHVPAGYGGDRGPQWAGGTVHMLASGAYYVMKVMVGAAAGRPPATAPRATPAPVQDHRVPDAAATGATASWAWRRVFAALRHPPAAVRATLAGTRTAGGQRAGARPVQ